jgi:acyl-coenzyme A synthetase/AMP-(fatty) acid ligase
LVTSSAFMKMPPEQQTSIRVRAGSASDCSRRFLWCDTVSLSLSDVLRGSSFSGRLQELSGRSVLLTTRDQFAAALALVELDGVAGRIIICPPDLSPEHLSGVIAKSGAEAIVSDQVLTGHGHPDFALRVVCSFSGTPGKTERIEPCSTEWVLLTSGTTGVPKMLIHTLRTLTNAIDSGQDRQSDIVWATFYDVRRFGGLQILLRAVSGRGSLVLSGHGEPLGDYLLRLGALGVTHISGTPSHWRRVLMTPQALAITPRYIRLSGEVADQAILNALHATYPQAAVGHAFASTEAGVAFEVNDGLEGFPASMIGAPGEVEMKVVNDSLRIRSGRTALGYLSGQNEALADDEGFVDTGDMVERRGERCYFLGRRNGVINIGGLKVYPEEVEAVINRHPAVRMSIVRPRKNPITGSLVAADVVLNREPEQVSSPINFADLKREIIQICRESLAAHKVPTTIRWVPALELATAGKLARNNA